MPHQPSHSRQEPRPTSRSTEAHQEAVIGSSFARLVVSQQAEHREGVRTSPHSIGTPRLRQITASFKKIPRLDETGCPERTPYTHRWRGVILVEVQPTGEERFTGRAHRRISPVAMFSSPLRTLQCRTSVAGYSVRRSLAHC